MRRKIKITWRSHKVSTLSSKETTLKRGLNALFLIKKLLLELFEKFEQLPFFYMSTINSLYSRLAAVDIEKSAIDAVTDTKDKYVDLNREQMLEGKNKSGQNLPSYLNDPYFKSPESALRYSQWKDKITPNSKRESGIMNFYIVGTFHKSITMDVSGLDINLDASFLGKEIVNTYGDQMFGLGGEIKQQYLQETLRPVFVSKIDLALNSK